MQRISYEIVKFHRTLLWNILALISYELNKKAQEKSHLTLIQKCDTKMFLFENASITSSARDSSRKRFFLLLRIAIQYSRIIKVARTIRLALGKLIKKIKIIKFQKSNHCQQYEKINMFVLSCCLTVIPYKKDSTVQQTRKSLEILISIYVQILGFFVCD